jgi:hypothetical protein
VAGSGVLAGYGAVREAVTVRHDGTPTESSTISGRVVAASKRGRRACAPAPVELYANFAPDMLLTTTSTDEHGRFVLECQGAFNSGDSYRVVAPRLRVRSIRCRSAVAEIVFLEAEEATE